VLSVGCGVRKHLSN